MFSAIGLLAQDTQPTGAKQLAATVVDAKPGAYYAPIGTDSKNFAAWTPIKVNDTVPPGSEIMTGMRAEVLLQIGDDTLVHVDHNTLAALDELYADASTKTTRLSVGFGKLSAGVAEGDLRSDLTIDTGVATLSKRGTWDFGVFKSRDGFVDFYLRERGLVDVLFKTTGQRRLLLPGQYVNTRTAMRTWVQQARLDRMVSMYDFASKTGSEINYDSFGGNSGLGVVAMGGGVETNAIAGRSAGDDAVNLAQEEDGGVVQQAANMFLNRHEGNFGFGDVPPGFNGELAKRLRNGMQDSHGGDLYQGEKVDATRRFVRPGERIRAALQNRIRTPNR